MADITHLRRFLHRAIEHSLIRYALTGGLMAVGMFGAFWILASAGLDARIAITMVYPFAIAVSFLINRRFTFGSERKISQSSWRFLLAHATGYVLNIALLTVFATWLGFPHLIVEAVVIVLVGLALWGILRFFVFPDTKNSGGIEA